MDYTIQEFYLANASEEKVPEHVYRSSGGYIDPVWENGQDFGSKNYSKFDFLVSKKV